MKLSLACTRMLGFAALIDICGLRGLDVAAGVDKLVETVGVAKLGALAESWDVDTLRS